MKEAKHSESEQESVCSEPAKEEEEEEGEEKGEEGIEGEQENSQILDTVMKASLPNSIYFNQTDHFRTFGTGQRLPVLLLVYRYQVLIGIAL